MYNTCSPDGKIACTNLVNITLDLIIKTSSAAVWGLPNPVSDPLPVEMPSKVPHTHTHPEHKVPIIESTKSSTLQYAYRKQ